jgi:hypothetical protein
MPISRVKVRAKITIGSLIVETPFIQSFNVNKQRGQVGTMSASLKVNQEEINGPVAGDNIKVFAGKEGDMPQIFTGIVKSAKISPCFDDPSYVIMSLTAADLMIMLRNKIYTRRCRATKASWTAITGVVRRGLKSGKFTYNTEPVIFKDAGKDKKGSERTATMPQASQNRGMDTSPTETRDPGLVSVQIVPLNPETGEEYA